MRAGTLGLLACTQGLQSSIADAALPALVSLLQDPYEAQGRVKAALAITNLASSSSLRQRIAQLALPGLVSLLHSPLSEGRAQALLALSCLAATETLRPGILIEAEGPLERLAEDGVSPQDRAAAAAALATLRPAKRSNWFKRKA